MALILTKSANRMNTFQGDTITYTVQIVNNNVAPITETSIIFKDIIPAGEKFIPDTFTINTVLQPLADPNLGVTLPNITSGGIAVVTYNTLVDNDPAPTILTNMAQASSIAQGQTIRITYYSNEVTIFVAFIELYKSADKSVAALTEEITYTVVLINQGQTEILNPIFKDVIPKCTQFIPGSVYIGGVNNLLADPTKGIALPNMMIGDYVSVSFKVKVTCVPCPPRFANTATLKYDLELVRGVFTSLTEVSNEVVTVAALSSFKQLSREEYVTIPSQKPDVEDVINVLVNIEITDTKVIKTIKNMSLEGQNLTGYKLIVEGILHQKVEYIAADMEQSVHAAHFRVPFSTYIILPQTFVEGTPIEVTGDVEDIYYQLINKRTVFKNITFKITAHY